MKTQLNYFHLFMCWQIICIPSESQLKLNLLCISTSFQVLHSLRELNRVWVSSSIKEWLKNRVFASFFFFSDEKLWKTFENKKNVWKLPKMYFNRPSGACCNQNFAKIHNTNDTRPLWVLLQWSRKSYWLVSGCLDDGRVVSVMSLKFGGV